MCVDIYSNSIGRIFNNTKAPYVLNVTSKLSQESFCVSESQGIFRTQNPIIKPMIHKIISVLWYYLSYFCFLSQVEVMEHGRLRSYNLFYHCTFVLFAWCQTKDSFAQKCFFVPDEKLVGPLISQLLFVARENFAMIADFILFFWSKYQESELLGYKYLNQIFS